MNPDDLPLQRRHAGKARQVDIVFTRSPDGITTVSRQRVAYPYHLGRTLHLAGDPHDMPSVYLQSCSGGLFEGDDLQQRIVAGPDTRAHITSAAPTIVHGMSTGCASQRVELEVQAGALLEYLPDPMILFPTARLINGLRLRVHSTAAAIIGDALILHDPQAGAAVFNSIESETLVVDESDKLLVCDRFRITGACLAQQTAGISGRHTCQGTIYVVSASAAHKMVAALRQALSAVSGVYADASTLPNRAGAWTRVLAEDAVALRAAMRGAWSAARTVLTGLSPGDRRK